MARNFLIPRSRKMNKTNIFMKSRELTNSLDLKTRELINSLDLKTRELVNSLVFTKMLVVFIFQTLSYLCIMYIHLYLCIHSLSKIVFNLRSTLKSNKFYLFSIKLKAVSLSLLKIEEITNLGN